MGAYWQMNIIEFKYIKECIEEEAELLAKSELSNFEYDEIFAALERMVNLGYEEGVKDTNELWELDR